MYTVRCPSLSCHIEWAQASCSACLPISYPWPPTTVLLPASVQRQWVVSYHLFCIFIISQCEEVLATQRERKRKLKEGKNRKFPWDISSPTKSGRPSQQPPEALVYLQCLFPSAWLSALSVSDRHFFAQVWKGRAEDRLHYTHQSRLPPEKGVFSSSVGWYRQEWAADVMRLIQRKKGNTVLSGASCGSCVTCWPLIGSRGLWVAIGIHLWK